MAYQADVEVALEMENNATDSGNGGYTWSTNGITYSAIIFKKGAYSATFDGTGTNYFYSTANITETIKTVQFFVYHVNAVGDYHLFTLGGANAWRIQSFNRTLFFYDPSGNFNIGPFTMTVGVWYRVNCVSNGATITIYVDGVSKGSKAWNNDMTGAVLHVGQFESGVADFVGNIDRFICSENTISTEIVPLPVEKTRILLGEFNKSRARTGEF